MKSAHKANRRQQRRRALATFPRSGSWPNLVRKITGYRTQIYQIDPRCFDGASSSRSRAQGRSQRFGDGQPPGHGSTYDTPKLASGDLAAVSDGDAAITGLMITETGWRHMPPTPPWVGGDFTATESPSVMGLPRPPNYLVEKSSCLIFFIDADMGRTCIRLMLDRFTAPPTTKHFCKLRRLAPADERRLATSRAQSLCLPVVVQHLAGAHVAQTFLNHRRK
jgi:hypothetical protein